MDDERVLRLSPVRRTVEILRQRAQTGTDERAANLQSSHAPPAVLRLRGNPPGTGRSVLPLQAVRGRSDIRRTGGAYHLRDTGVRGLPLRDDHAPVAFAESTAPIMEKSISERSK